MTGLFVYLFYIHTGGIIMANIETRKAPINIRALASQRTLIDKAAAALNKSRSDFMLYAACREAENVLLDQRLFILRDDEFEAF